MSEHDIELRLNGAPARARVEARRSLADFIRIDAGLTGTHVGCEHGVCGACTVIVDGQAVRSCLILAVQANGRSVRTVEGLAADDGALHPVQQAMQDAYGLQCGFCTPGILMTMVAAMEADPGIGKAALADAVSGHLCRCTGYQGILDAIQRLTGGAA